MFRINEYRKPKTCKDIKVFFWFREYPKLQDALESIKLETSFPNMKKVLDSWKFQVVKEPTGEVVYEKTII